MTSVTVRAVTAAALAALSLAPTAQASAVVAQPAELMTLADAISRLPIAAEAGDGYVRTAFKHWVDDDRDHCDTRAEVLIWRLLCSRQPCGAPAVMVMMRFDKVTRLRCLPYPGDPAIDRATRTGNPDAVASPRPLTKPGDDPYAFSFSGLKTTADRWVEQHRVRGVRPPVADGAAALQEAVADVLTGKALRACRDHGVGTLIVVGGVAANSRVRALAEQRCRAAGIELRVPPMTLCTDNGAMTAAVSDLLVRPAPLHVSVDPSAPLEYTSLTPTGASAAGVGRRGVSRGA